MDIEAEIRRLLDTVLSLNGRSADFTLQTRLLGAIPEFDSMAVVNLITSLEEVFGITVDDDDVDAETFATVGSLCSFVSSRLES